MVWILKWHKQTFLERIRKPPWSPYPHIAHIVFALHPSVFCPPFQSYIHNECTNQSSECINLHTNLWLQIGKSQGEIFWSSLGIMDVDQPTQNWILLWVTSPRCEVDSRRGEIGKLVHQITILFYSTGACSLLHPGNGCSDCWLGFELLTSWTLHLIPDP